MSEKVDSNERKITVESRAIGFFFGFILIEGYLLISMSLGVFPFKIIGIPPQVKTEYPSWLFALYWIGILFLLLGLLIGKYNKIYPPIVLIGSIIFFVIIILPLSYI